eukprot:6346991-Pyramimonas_sp.AAC.1
MGARFGGQAWVRSESGVRFLQGCVQVFQGGGARVTCDVVKASSSASVAPTPSKVAMRNGRRFSRSGLEILHTADGWHFGWT